MFIDTRMIPRLALQRSAMFATKNNQLDYVSLLRSEENLVELVFYKHFIPTGRGAVWDVGRYYKSRQKNKKFSVCFAEMRTEANNWITLANSELR